MNLINNHLDPLHETEQKVEEAYEFFYNQAQKIQSIKGFSYSLINGFYIQILYLLT
ncbi:hypothetical protein [Bacillus thermotolerans]|uniref:Uncharacterized protein n=1 Tax=Bacillus thermotolerans TaxID=1221996 RepID=A0A0F5HNW7_BACTR|nr:hypothetical protein [Bacillus thermotolerans]KKB34117.1 hypothetical protein QY97_02629 [Bacillus thermotolerans]KKB35059.1 hypothetical protein QY95_03630 [Bacillus thermotolerans]